MGHTFDIRIVREVNLCFENQMIYFSQFKQKFVSKIRFGQSLHSIQIRFSSGEGEGRRKARFLCALVVVRVTLSLKPSLLENLGKVQLELSFPKN